MKTSWIIGVVMMYILILSVELVVTGGTAFGTTAQGNLNGLTSNTMTNYSSGTSAFTAIFSQAGSYFMTFLNAVMLWSPTLFSGYYVYFWLFFCLPIDIGMVMSIAQVARGVHAS